MTGALILIPSQVYAASFRPPYRIDAVVSLLVPFAQSALDTMAGDDAGGEQDEQSKDPNHCSGLTCFVTGRPKYSLLTDSCALGSIALMGKSTGICHQHRRNSRRRQNGAGWCIEAERRIMLPRHHGRGRT